MVLSQFWNCDLQIWPATLSKFEIRDQERFVTVSKFEHEKILHNDININIDNAAAHADANGNSTEMSS